MSQFNLVTPSLLWQRLLNKVKDVSQQSTMDNKLGCLLLKNRKVISAGYNRNNRSHFHGLCTPSVHAEMDALHCIAPLGKPYAYSNLWSSAGFEPGTRERGAAILLETA
jgi:tRNA(Arg) A34 adenosine deaminase TadA